MSANVEHSLPAARARLVRVECLDRCPNCAASEMVTWSASVRPEALHIAQSRCRVCGVIFANPRLLPDSIQHFYESEYYGAGEDRFAHLPSGPGPLPVPVEIERILTYVPRGRMLDVGCGPGDSLAIFRQLGFEVTGVDPAADAIEHARRHFGLQDVHVGTLETVPLAPETFDLVFSWHVIEHVLELDAFIGGMRRVLRPSGILCLGTENYPNAYDLLGRLRARATGRTPPFVTSSEHTFLFSARTLSEALARRGFRCLLGYTYQHPWRVRRRNLRFRSPLGWAYFAAVHAANAIARTGPRLQVIAQRV